MSVLPPKKHPEIPTLAPIREFATGATRDTDEGKLDYEAFLSPLVLACYAYHMDKHRRQRNGVMRDPDNWQKGIPKEAYMKSMWRHFMDVWRLHRGWSARDDLEGALCALLFNVHGMLHEYLKAKYVEKTPKEVSWPR